MFSILRQLNGIAGGHWDVVGGVSLFNAIGAARLVAAWGIRRYRIPPGIRPSSPGWCTKGLLELSEGLFVQPLWSLFVLRRCGASWRW